MKLFKPSHMDSCKARYKLAYESAVDDMTYPLDLTEALIKDKSRAARALGWLGAPIMLLATGLEQIPYSVLQLALISVSSSIAFPIAKIRDVVEEKFSHSKQSENETKSISNVSVFNKEVKESKVQEGNASKSSADSKNADVHSSSVPAEKEVYPLPPIFRM